MSLENQNVRRGAMLGMVIGVIASCLGGMVTTAAVVALGHPVGMFDLVAIPVGFMLFGTLPFIGFFMLLAATRDLHARTAEIEGFLEVQFPGEFEVQADPGERVDEKLTGRAAILAQRNNR